MIKSFKIFERFWFRNIVVGEIYYISKVGKYWEDSIPLCKVIEIDDYLRTIYFETYSSKTKKKLTYNFHFNIIIRKATDEEKLYFKTLEDINKYNL